VPDFDSWFE
jgi:hypothetical protein